MKNTLKTIIVLIVIIVIIFGSYTYGTSDFGPRYANRADIREILEHQIDTYKLIESINHRMEKSQESYQVLTHYISGHDFKHPLLYCPECGLLDSINRRSTEIDGLIYSLSIRNGELSDEDKVGSEEYKSNSVAMQKLTEEQLKIRSHLFNADERSKAVNQIMRDHRVIRN